MVAIKDMKMPKSCSECSLAIFDSGNWIMCFMTLDILPDEITENFRMPDCPLVEVLKDE